MDDRKRKGLKAALKDLHPPVFCQAHQDLSLSGEHNEGHPQLWAGVRREEKYTLLDE